MNGRHRQGPDARPDAGRRVLHPVLAAMRQASRRLRAICRAPALFVAALSGCSAPLGDVRPALYATAPPVVHPAEITFLLPGALTTAEIFRPAQDWATPTHRIVEYRLPGMQGEPVSPSLDIVRSATWVADYANRHPDAKINLLGYSTGAAIAIEAAGRITDSRRVRVAAVSSPTPFPGAGLAALRGVVGAVTSAVSIGSLNKQKVWEDYYKTLYFGTGWRKSAAKVQKAAQLAEIVQGRVMAPGKGVVRAQSGKLLFWTPSAATRETDAQIVFFHGARDPVFPLRSVRRLATWLGAGLCVLPEDGHLVFQSNSDIMMRLESYFATGAHSGTCG